MDKFFYFFTKTLAVWILAFGIIAYIYPSPFIYLHRWMDWYFFLTMFGIGAALKPADFEQIVNKPRMVAIGVIAQFSVMPLSAYLIARLFHLPPEIALGLILAGCAPGAMASNVMCYVAGADVAYSVSLTAASTLLTPVMTPLLTFLLASAYLEVNIAALFWTVTKIVVLPIILGVYFRYLFTDHLGRILKVFPFISSTFIIFICSIVIALNKDRLGLLTLSVFAAVITLNITGLCAGYGIGRLFNFAQKSRRALSIEIGMQNAGLGTVLALKHFGKTQAVPTAAFVFICVFTAAFLVSYWQRSAQGR